MQITITPIFASSEEIVDDPVPVSVDDSVAVPQIRQQLVQSKLTFVNPKNNNSNSTSSSTTSNTVCNSVSNSNISTTDTEIKCFSRYVHYSSYRTANDCFYKLIALYNCND